MFLPVHLKVPNTYSSHQKEFPATLIIRLISVLAWAKWLIFLPYNKKVTRLTPRLWPIQK